MTGRAVIGIDLGGTKIAAGAVTPAGQVFAARTVPTPAAGGSEAVLARAAALVRETARAARAEGWTTAGVGVATPGIVDPEDGSIIFATPALPGWTGTRLRERIAEATGLAVAVQNDAHAAAWGEWRAGAGRGTSHMVMVTLGTGIGGGVITGSTMLMGSRGAAGRIGHVSVDVNGRPCFCGGMGCIEQYASGTAIARAAREATERGVETSLRRRGTPQGLRPSTGSGRTENADPGPLTAGDVVAAARSGDACATSILAEAGRYLGAALATLVNLFNPEAVVIGGGVAEAGDLLLGPAEGEMRRRLLPILAEPVAVRRALLGAHAAVLGVAFWAWDRLSLG